MWGCDAPATEPVWMSTCPECLRYDLECKRCGGTGEVAHFRCPKSMTDQEGHFAYAAAVQSSYGNLPADGGWAEQSAVSAALVGVANLEISRIREAEQERQEQRARRG